jgi:hypothetical protein
MRDYEYAEAAVNVEEDRCLGRDGARRSNEHRDFGSVCRGVEDLTSGKRGCPG